MHLRCLGVMKKLLLIWMRGKKNDRLSANQIYQISSRLYALKPSIPNCFARKARGLDDVDCWKATEFRQFLLYTGKQVLKGIPQSNLFDHFMTFSVASSILVCLRIAAEHGAYANDLLTLFCSIRPSRVR